MKRYSTLTIELTVLAVAAGLSVRLPSAGADVQTVLWFVLGLTVLTFFDVWLPRGDSVGMSAALVLCTLLLLDSRVVLSMLLVAEMAALVPKGGVARWESALGALTVKSVAGVSCSALLIPLGIHPSTGLLHTAGVLKPEQYLVLVLVGVLFAALEFFGMLVEAAARTGLRVRTSVLGGMSFGVWLVAAQASAGVLAALMHRTMGPWGLGIAVVMILVMRQSFVLLLEIRQAYDATIDVLIRAMEAQSPEREGVAEENAFLAVVLGREIGLHGGELERLRYAALLLGLGAERGLEGVAPDVDGAANSGSARIVEDVDFLKGVVPVLRLCDSPSETASCRRADLICAYAAMSVGTVTGTTTATQLSTLAHRVSPRIRRDIERALVVAMASAANATLRKRA